MGPPPPEVWRQAMRLLDEVLELPAERRLRYLDELDVEPPVRASLERLLASAGDPSDQPLESAEEAVATLVSRLRGEEPATLLGRHFGPFQLEEELGQGGMSLVFRARRTSGPFPQSVAVKILPVGRLTEEGIARFRREQAILARLRHPNITTLLDGGISDDGTPWIATELIDGRPIDRWVEESGAEGSAVVRTVLAVCEAVAYAHRSLVVHRDLKPGNVLVDADGHVHLLDFGIAKLLDEAAGEPGRPTATLAMTPDYAAPEQLAGEPVTTATDVFGLGALLYRLLAGAPPFVGRTPYDPTRFERLTPLDRQPRRVPGTDRDLERVLGKALSIEPERRYPTAAAYAADLRRWLAGEPVEAGPDRASYRLRKLVRRHRTAFVGAALVALSLLTGVATTVWQARLAHRRAREAAEEAERARQQARRAEEVTQFLVDTFTAADPGATSGEEVTAREILDKAAERIDADRVSAPADRRRMLALLGDLSLQLGDHAEAAALLEAALTIPAPDPGARVRDLGFLATAHWSQGAYEEADRLYRTALPASREPGVAGSVRAELVIGYANFLANTGRPAECEEVVRAALSEPWSERPEQRAARATLLDKLAISLDRMARYEEAREAVSEALALHSTAGNGELPHANALRTLSNIELQLGRLEQAEEAERQALAVYRRVYGESHPTTLGSRNNVATHLKARGAFADSARVLRSVEATQRRVLGDDHPHLAVTLANLGEAYLYAGELEEALTSYAEAVRIGGLSFGPQDPMPAVFQALLARALGRAGRPREAETAFAESVGRLADLLPEGHPLSARIDALYAGFLNDTGRAEEAARLAAPALAALEKALPADSPRIALARLELARGLERADPGRCRSLAQQAETALAESPRARQYSSELALARRLLDKAVER